MPASPRPVLSWPSTVLVLAVIPLAIALLVALCCGWIFAGLLVGTLISLGVLSAFTVRRRLADLAVVRQGESICTFARSFGRRAVDTWVIRAVYEELQPYCRSVRVTLPLRVTDHLEEVLGIDAEELDDVAEDIAHRTGRPLDVCDRNPFYGKVVTVGDLVWFFAHQPLKGASLEV
jgi:hypothetical protein